MRTSRVAGTVSSIYRNNTRAILSDTHFADAINSGMQDQYQDPREQLQQHHGKKKKYACVGSEAWPRSSSISKTCSSLRFTSCSLYAGTEPIKAIVGADASCLLWENMNPTSPLDVSTLLIGICFPFSKIPSTMHSSSGDAAYTVTTNGEEISFPGNRGIAAHINKQKQAAAAIHLFQ